MISSTHSLTHKNDSSHATRFGMAYVNSGVKNVGTSVPNDRKVKPKDDVFVLRVSPTKNQGELEIQATDPVKETVVGTFIIAPDGSMTKKLTGDLGAYPSTNQEQIRRLTFDVGSAVNSYESR